MEDEYNRLVELFKELYPTKKLNVSFSYFEGVISHICELLNEDLRKLFYFIVKDSSFFKTHKIYIFKSIKTEVFLNNENTNVTDKMWKILINYIVKTYINTYPCSSVTSDLLLEKIDTFHNSINNNAFTNIKEPLMYFVMKNNKITHSDIDVLFESIHTYYEQLACMSQFNMSDIQNQITTGKLNKEFMKNMCLTMLEQMSFDYDIDKARITSFALFDTFTDGKTFNELISINMDLDNSAIFSIIKYAIENEAEIIEYTYNSLKTRNVNVYELVCSYIPDMLTYISDETNGMSVFSIINKSCGTNKSKIVPLNDDEVKELEEYMATKKL